MTQRLVVLTGASRGLGAAMARRLLSPDTTLLCLSRRSDAALADAARETGSACEQWQVDLVEAVPIGAGLEVWLKAFPADRFDAAVLVNNAAVLTRIGPVEAGTGGELATAIRVGLEAPLVLTAAFLRATAELARRSTRSQHLVGARAAGDGRTGFVLRRQGGHRPSLAPSRSTRPGCRGRTDRGAGAGRHRHRHAGAAAQRRRPRLPRPRAVRAPEATGQLASPDSAAERVLAYLARDDFGVAPVADIRDA